MRMVLRHNFVEVGDITLSANKAEAEKMFDTMRRNGWTAVKYESRAALALAWKSTGYWVAAEDPEINEFGPVIP